MKEFWKIDDYVTARYAGFESVFKFCLKKEVQKARKYDVKIAGDQRDAVKKIVKVSKCHKCLSNSGTEEG